VAGVSVGLIVVTILAPFVVLPGWNATQARELLRFGLPLAGASLLVLAVFNVDSAIVGAVRGAVALGLYQLAFNISSWPSRSISEIIRRVSFAGFSRVAHSPELLADSFVRAFGLVVACTVPACALLAALAEPLVRLIYGPRWTAAAQVLVWLAILGLLRVLYDLIYDCLAAAGRRPSLLIVQGWWLATLIPVLLVGARTHGIVGVGIGHVLVAGLLVCPAFLWALSRCGIKVRSILAVCLRPFLGGILMTAICELALRFLGEGLAGFAVGAVAGLAAYLLVVFPMRALLRPSGAGPSVLDEVRAA
jgi:PST family polysaccharide transporter